MGQDRDPIINKEQRRAVLSGNPELLQKGRGRGHLFISVFSHTPICAAVGGRNAAPQPVCSAKDDRTGQIPHIPDTKPIPWQQKQP